MTDDRTGIWLVRKEALPIGLRLQQLPGADLFQPWLQPDVPQKEQFRQQYRCKSRWVMVMASGIAVRFMEGLPKDKFSDPAVVVLDEGCGFAISLLAGHEGGANSLTYEVARCVGATPVITTATEALKSLVIGIGCRRGISADTIEEAVRHALQEKAINNIREVATIDVKANEPGLLAFCARHDLPLRVFSRRAIAGRSWVTQPSAWVQRVIGVDGVCEPCALLASPRGSLVVPKLAQNGVTVAVVEDRLEWI